MLFYDELRGFLQIADAGVITKTFPQLVDFGRRRVGSGFNRWQFAHPAFPKWDHGFHLRLLQHDFGYKYTIGVICTVSMVNLLRFLDTIPIDF